MPNATAYVPKIWQQLPRRITPARRKALLAKRDAWLRQINPTNLFFPLFDLLPGVHFFAKNRQGELMLSSMSNLEMYHVTDEAQFIGLTDFDLNPAPMARAYVRDDAAIYATGQPLVHRLELWFDQMGVPDWFLVSKFPIRSRAGEIIGIMGISQTCHDRARLLPLFGGVARAMDYIRQNYHQDISVGQLARLASLSSRQLQRKFKILLSVRPQEFLIKTRVLAACNALRETENTLAEIALACGFCDQSAFAHHFHKHVGQTPSRFRNDQSGK